MLTMPKLFPSTRLLLSLLLISLARPAISEMGSPWKRQEERKIEPHISVPTKQYQIL